MASLKGGSSWADDSDEESYSSETWEDFDKIKFVKADGTPMKKETWGDEDFVRDELDNYDDYETENIYSLNRDDRIFNEIQILTDPESKIFRQESVDTICNYDLTPLLKHNFPNPKLMEAISATFSDNVSENGIAPPLRQKFFTPLVDSSENQMRYVIKTESGVSFVLRREDYRDYGEDVIHQYLIMSLIATKIWKKVPMIAYPFGIFSASKFCEYTGDATRDEDKLYNFLLISYVPFNREDNTGANKSSNDPNKRQMSFHVAMAPPRRGTQIVKPLLSPTDGWYLIQMMNAFLRYASYFYVFSHGDAHYHNWYLRDLGDTQRIDIPIVEGGELSGGVKSFYTRYLPVLSDFGRSSFVYDKQRYGMNSKYYAVPPPYNYIDYHDLVQLMYGFVKDLDYIGHERRGRNYWLDTVFNRTIKKYVKNYPELSDIDVVKGTQERGTSFAELGRLLSGKVDIANDIFEQLDKLFTPRNIITNNRLLRPSTDPIRILSLKCQPMPKFPAVYKNPKLAEEDSRSRSETIIYLRENEEEETIEDIRDYLFRYMNLTLKTNSYDSKEGLIIDIIIKRLDKAGITYRQYTDEEKKIFNNFQDFKVKKDLEHREKKFATSSAQSELVGQLDFVETRASPAGRGGYSQSRGGSSVDSEGFRPAFSRKR